MSGSILPTDVRRKLMSDLSSNRLQTRDYWEYAVAKSWLEHWQLLGDEQTLTSIASPVTMDLDDANNTYVPETQWKMYAMWFGIDNSYQYRRRPVISSYLPLSEKSPSTVLFDRELDFLPISYGFLGDHFKDESIKELRVFAWDSFDYIGSQIRRLMDIAKHRQIRLWFNIRSQTVDIALEPVFEGARILIGQVLYAFPEFEDVLLERQVQVRREHAWPGDENIRRPLEIDWKSFISSVTIAVLVEEIGVHLGGPRASTDRNSGLDEQIDSIMTISSIRNQWDDVLTRTLETFTEELGERSLAVKEQLLESARVVVGEKLQEVDQIREELTARLQAVTGREEEVLKREETVAVEEKELKRKLELYKSALGDFQMHQKRLAEEMKRIESQNKISEAMVNLNVGGNHVTTSVATLTKIENSFLAQMFSGRHNLHRQQDGSYFIDRDGTNFRHILNYLREGPDSIKSIPDKVSVLQELIVEGEYFKLPEFVRGLRARLADFEERAETRSLGDSGVYKSY